MPCLVGQIDRGGQTAHESAERTGRQAADLGDVAIIRLARDLKLGQFLATRPDVVGPRVVQELEKLQDKMAAFPREVAVRTIENAFGQKLGDVFVSLGEPVAAASIAQVHEAETAGDVPKRVAVKILRPNVEDAFARDFDAFRLAARLAERLGVAPATVAATLQRMMRDGLVEMERGKTIRFTER